MILRTIADELNQNTFLLEENARRSLQNGRDNELQAILDQTFALNDVIAEISISKDGQTIYASSSRTLINKPIANDYIPFSQLHEGLLNHQHTAYKIKFYYFEGSQKHTAYMLIRIDKGYVFGRSNQIAILYGIGILTVLSLLSLLLFTVIQRLAIKPLGKITQHAHTGSTSTHRYFIKEFSELAHTLSETFQSMHHQQHELQLAYDETKYLDGILRTVADINQLLISANNIDELISKSVNRLAGHSGYTLCWLTLKSNNSLPIQAYSPDPTGLLQLALTITHNIDEQSDDPVVQACILSKTVVITHLSTHTSNLPWRQVAEHGGYGSFIALPLLPSLYEQPIGVLGLYAQKDDGFNPKEIAMLEELAGDIGFAIQAFKQREQLKRHLTTDAITDLPNRTSLVDQLIINPEVSLALINIDRFSDINSVYGVTIGDGILAQYGQWLAKFIAPFNGVTLFKMGNDEYALLFTEPSAVAQHKELLEQIIAMSAKELFVIGEIEVMLTITVGMVVASDKLLEHATTALKQAKLTHKNMQIYEFASIQKDQENNIAWYKRIKDAVEDSRIAPYFQPIVDNKTQRIIKYEALVRLIEKDGNVISPYQFLAISKKTRQYGQLTKIMFDKVVQQFHNSSVPVSINLSTEDLLNSELADYLEQTILSHQIGNRLIFEILESEGIDNYTEVSAFVDRFKSIGCRFAIDDFGSGYSNFDHLLKLNIDTLKIDSSLIKNLPHDRNAQIIVKHISDFAREMGINTVAEFVANEAIYQMVLDMGIDASQGYYFYEPSAWLIPE
ncbi:sensor domain-containing diguanylate cyclase [Sulfuriferula nivalis]|uniref:Diguanylate cyclase/phosphodiesterase n=1 Tax=Sulfuriferula nivalis TaxID=2675298 RepID=A0A809S260_9PROT|nr:GGDEF domain-containing protein [Sulfuriferula nivalis]BBP00718.1 hypothetical protein SFSGTM_14260 [Sulfuriferula nivalis]